MAYLKIFQQYLRRRTDQMYDTLGFDDQPGDNVYRRYMHMIYLLICFSGCGWDASGVGV